MFRRSVAIVDGDISVSDLRRVVKQLDTEQPLTDAYEMRTVGRGSGTYANQRQHLIGWLGEYNSTGYYNRKNPSTSGKTFYNHFRCAAGLVWLAEALGEDQEVLAGAIAVIEAGSSNPSSECAAFRRAVSWDRIVELVAAR
jgi:hypothetical protein